MNAVHFGTVDEQLNKLSTRAKRITRDVVLANNIGRDSPFDPFQKRDISLLLSEKYDASRTLMYFPKEIAKNPHVLVDMARAPPGHDLNQVRPPSTQSVYSPQLVPTVKDVSFTKAKRFSYARPGSREDGAQKNEPIDPAAMPEELRRKMAMLVGGNDHSSPSANFIMKAQLALEAQAAQDALAMSLSGAGSPDRRRTAATPQPSTIHREVPTSCVNDSYSAAASFGRMSGRNGLEPARHPPQPARRKHQQVFPWERNQQGQGKKPGTAPAGGGGGDRPSTRIGGGMAASRSDRLLDATSSDGGGAVSSGGLGGEETAEEWERKRKALISRFGLLHDAVQDRTRRAREQHNCPTDLRRTTARDAPVFFAERGKERNDIFYEPKYGVTGRERSVSKVNIGGFASREVKHSMAHLANVDRALNPNNLSKLHQRLEDARKSDLLRRPDLQALSKSQQGVSQSLGTSSLGPDEDPDEELLNRALSQADDLNCHRESLYAPKPVTRLYRGAPDMGLYATRSDEPISSMIIGGTARSLPKGDSRPASRVSTAMSSAGHGGM